jgi:hypothetical protein
MARPLSARLADELRRPEVLLVNNFRPAVP